ncbi:tape measure protein [Viridibacillus sp. NPDC096237]|uniref:tape measure protein n=1 Tax=Viridibacillus sp. NPDC096237 TaxID=3390721 RepID=UPI003D06EC60
MATIRTAIQIQDGMSRAFQSMNTAMNVVLSSFESLQDASSNAIDTASIETARAELNRAEQAFSEIEQEIRNADEAQQQFNNNIRDGTSSADGLLQKIMGIAAAYLGFQSAGNVVSLSDEMTNTTARLDLMNDKLQTTVELQEMIFESAKRTYTPYQQTADMVGKLGMQARDAFSSNEELIAFAEQINKTFTIAGTSVEGVESVMLQLTQAMASGVLQGEELAALLDNAQPIVQNIADYMDVPFGSIKKLASEGQITAEIVKNAMFQAAEQTNAAFETMPLTWSKIWTNIKNDAFKAFQPILQSINDIANNTEMQNVINAVVNGLYTLSAVAVTTFDILTTAGSFMYNNWSLIAPVLGTVTMAIGAYTTALVINKAAEIVSVFWTGAKTLAIGLMTTSSWAGVQATIALTAAQWGLNTALMANPVFIIVMAIIILIGALYLAVEAVNYFAGTSISATGIVAGAFMVLVTFIYNKIAFLWNIFAAIAEFFVNVWQHPIYSVKKLFANLVNNFLDQTISMSSGWDSFATSFVNAMISAVNGAIKAWNWFVDMLPSDIASSIGLGKGEEFEYRTSITSDLKGIKKGINAAVGKAPEDYWEAPKMEMKSLGAAWDTGYDWGSNLFSKDAVKKEKDKKDKPDNDMQSLIDNVKGLQPPANNAADAANRAAGNGGKTAGNTAKMAKAMEGATDDLKYMRDLADREVINRFTTAKVKVDFSSVNTIKSDLDLDGIIDKFGEKLEEAITVAAEGVH